MNTKPILVLVSVALIGTGLYLRFKDTVDGGDSLAKFQSISAVFS